MKDRRSKQPYPFHKSQQAESFEVGYNLYDGFVAGDADDWSAKTPKDKRKSRKEMRAFKRGLLGMLVLVFASI